MPKAPKTPKTPKTPNGVLPPSPEGAAVFERGDAVLLLEHPREVVLIGETDAERDLGNACLTAQQQRRRLFQAAVITSKEFEVTITTIDSNGGNAT